MRTRLLLLFSLLLGATSLFAQGWTPKTSFDYYDETPYWVNLSVVPASPAAPDVTLAAFIDGDCRALCDAPVSGYYQLRVVGDLTADLNKDIVFKAFAKEGNNGPLIYVFKTKGKFTGNGVFGFPLTLDLFQGIALPTEINVAASLPTTYDLSQHFTYNFGNGGASTNVDLESALSFAWSPASSTSIASISSGNMLTTTSTEGSTDMTLTVTGTQYAGFTQYSSQATTTVNVSKMVVPVSSLTFNPTFITVQLGDVVLDKLAEQITVTVLPENATDKGYSWDFSGSSEYIDPVSSMAFKAGTTKIICKSNDQHVSTSFYVYIKEVSFKVPDVIPVSMKEEVEIPFVSWKDEDDLFDPSLVSFEMQVPYYGNGDSIMKVRIDDEGYIYLQGKYVGDWAFQVLYNGIPMETVGGDIMGTAQVKAVLELPGNGWSWRSICYTPGGLQPADHVIPLQENNANVPFMANVVELRTQKDLLYNDNGILYGAITKLDPMEGMYKVRINGTSSTRIDLGSDAFVAATVDGIMNFEQPIKKGYNWMTYPYDVDLEMNELASVVSENAVMDDQIIGQQGFATYDGNSWITSGGFKFEAGKGYIYLSHKDTPYDINFNFSGIPVCYQSAPTSAREMDFRPWKVKNDGFIDNMPAIIQIAGLPGNGDYMVGAFVDGECRGEAKVGKDGLTLISVPGKSGEQVLFRIYNKENGEEFTLDQTIRCSVMAGRLSQPLQFSAPDGITGINTVPVVNQGKGQTVFSLSGQRLAAPAKGVNVVNGKKVIF